ncbi:MAG TPA: GAF domain-containing sensor histidine kinase [Chloroflexi bacterium]|nr:GAF domain-containing sensor histidine kinase [Chloroflexota bacterium]
MTTTTTVQTSIKRRFQADWVISNLRWLLLLSVALVRVADVALVRQQPFDPLALLPQIILLIVAAFYNLSVMLLLTSHTIPQSLPTMTIVVDTVLSIGFVLTSGGLESPLLFFGLFPILTAALRFHWSVSILIAIVIVASCGGIGYILTPAGTPWSILLPFTVRATILLLATLVSSLVGHQMKRLIAQTHRVEQEAELRKLRTAQEHSRVIFELASTLSATLNYNKVLDAVLEVGEAGMRELGRHNPAQISLVMLFGQRNLQIVASRHLPYRDQNATFEGKAGAIAQALSTVEAVVISDPASDPELCQLIAMHSCKEAIVVPLRAGFENYGVVVFGSEQANTYTDDQKELLIAVCNQAIVALQNAQLYQSLIEEKERIVEVEEDARKKLARDLHDGPTQSIAAIAMRLNYIRMLLDREQDTGQAIEEITKVEDMARRTTKEIRHMLFTLRPLILESQGLRAALEQYITKLAETDPLPIHLEAAPDVDRVLEQNAQGVIFYIIEEAIGNARKHARANNLWVRLRVQDGYFIAEVEDDGVGFDVNAVQTRYDERGSLGMINMHERAELVNGRISIASAPGKGTRITLTAPIQKR